LKDDPKYSYTICALCLVLAGFLTWRRGYRDAMFILITTGATIVLCLVGVFLLGILVPPVYKRVGGDKAFDKVPSMFTKDKPGTDKKS